MGQRIQPRGSGVVCPEFGKDCLTKGAAKSLAKRRDGSRAYKCRYCGKWHVGSLRGRS